MRDKFCPKCNVKHVRPGVFCSRKCANSRTWDKSDKIKKSVANKQYYYTDQGKAQRAKLSAAGKIQKHSSETKAKIASSSRSKWTSERRQHQARVMAGRKVTDEQRKKMSEIARNRGFGGHTSKRKLYFEKHNGSVVYLQSSYEIRFAEILEKVGIVWERPEPLTWVDENGKYHRYYPDFKVGNVYIDTKNDYLAIKDLPKIQRVRTQNNIDLRIVLEQQITEEYIRSLV